MADGVERDLLANLTPAQREAVMHFEGPLLVLAGAGSGKTRVITRRVAHLLHLGVRPANILAITFTNKAAGEMRQRIEALVPGRPVWISTFHSFGARILRQYAERLGLDRNYTIYDQADRGRLLKIALEDAEVDNVRFTPEAIGSAVSKAKNQLLGPERYAERATDFFGQTVARVYPAYEKRLRDANALDFDDLLYWPALALKHDAELRAELDARFRFVLIDEYQDTNYAQYGIVRGLSVDYPNLCVVGDPDQCLPPGTLVATPDGSRPIETLRDGDRVISAKGWGATAAKWVDKVMLSPFKGRLVKIRVEGGIVVRATPNHMCFARLLPSPSTRLVYLMWKRGVGYRVGMTRGVRVSKDGIIASGLQVRANQEVADAMWVLRTCASGVGQFHDADLISRARLTTDTISAFMPASHIHPGMAVPVMIDDQVVERRVVAVDWEEYEGPVYDLSVPDTHNFVANGLVVHNSIYKFRGSDIKNILDFERDFPNARVLTLERNYRSTKAILHTASHLIAHNRQRKPKDLVTENPSGQPVTVLTYETGLDEADGIARRIRDAVHQGKRAYHDFAIFLRVNALSRALETAFLKLQVPFQIVRGLAFFERKENRDVIAYLRLLPNPRDDLSFLRAVNEPARGIGKVSLEHLRAYAEPRGMSLLAAAGEVSRIPAIKGKAARSLTEFAQLIRELSGLTEQPPDEVIRQVLERTGYRAMLKDSRDPEDQERLANIEELITAAKQFAAEDASRTVGDFLENITLASDVDSWDERQDCVSVMTLHAAKGLEFPVVYMVAVEQGLLPHERSLARDDEVEEERRLAFVGITRAKEELYLSHARLREFRGATLYAIPSMFLDELPQDAIQSIDLSASAAGSRRAIEEWRGGGPAAAQGWIDAGVAPRAPQEAPPPGEFAEGMIVRHESYGQGRVVEVSGYGALRKVKVRFSSGERTFLVEKAKLEIVRKS